MAKRVGSCLILVREGNAVFGKYFWVGHKVCDQQSCVLESIIIFYFVTFLIFLANSFGISIQIIILARLFYKCCWFQL